MKIASLKVVCLFAVVTVLVFAAPVRSVAQQKNTDETKGSDFVKPVTCADTQIAAITDRFGHKLGTMSNGMNAGTAVKFVDGTILISYDINRIVALEHVGNRIQLCFLGHIEAIDGCVPAADKRGLIYRAYDYKLHVAYTMMNSQHVCGGA
jgi:hypothetical protein